MIQIRIDNITGGVFPISVFIADTNLNNKTLINTINPGPVPPTQNLNQTNSTIPTIFNTASQIVLIIQDANGCEVFKVLDCIFGCAFDITVNLVDCVIDMVVTLSEL